MRSAFFTGLATGVIWGVILSIIVVLIRERNDMTNYILIDAATRRPIPLPFHTTYVRQDTGETKPARIDNFSPPRKSPLKRFRERGSITVVYDSGPPYFGVDPEDFGLIIVTEADFMAEQSND